MEWKSKLGRTYPKDFIEKYNFQAKLDELRKQEPANRHCADCGIPSTPWASVNLGVFLCMRCGSIHRGLGTHLSKPKGCTGTYLWGPDEIENMSQIGNERARIIYGGEAERPPADASQADWTKYIKDKYERRLFSNLNKESLKQGTSSTGGFQAYVSSEDVKSKIVKAGATSALTPASDLLSFPENETLLAPKQRQIDFFQEYGL